MTPQATYTFACAKVATGYALYRNEVFMKTPAGHALIVPTIALAESIVTEWKAQGAKIKPATMPMTQLALTAVDLVAKDHDGITVRLSGYIDSDLLCHFADRPEALCARQKAVWQPIIDWCARRFDIVIQPTAGIRPVAQPEASRNTLRQVMATYDTFALTGLQQMADVSGSIILALALTEKHLNAAQIFMAAELEALFQAEQWGEDVDKLARQTDIKNELGQYEQWFSLLSRTG